MKRFLEYLFVCVFVVFSSSCNIDGEITTTLPPKIVLDSQTGIYTVKQGREITISPSYKSADGAKYSWTMEGEVVCTSASLSFKGNEPGQHFITIAITTDGGSDEEEIRIDVIELEIPTVSIAGNKHQTVAVGTTINFTASVRATSLPTTLEWDVNGTSVGNEPTYTFNADAVGSYTITATASNEDGTHCDKIDIEVLNADDMPLVWEFDRTTYHTVAGRKLLIAPSTHNSDEGISYSWQLAGKAEPQGNDARFVFTAETAGEYQITATATTEKDGGLITITHEFNITVYEAGAFYRAKSAVSKADWNKVYEYTPAPGQFINELKTGGFNASHINPEAAVAYAEDRLNNNIWVSLGGFGGYVVVGFDHSITNTRGYDLGVVGNAFDGSSEPGVVWVMQDENGNGFPDDTWYELAGSETGKVETYRDYAVTYYRPTGTGMPVQWTDNYGNTGEVDYLEQFHDQDYYYPLWIGADSYTLTGTRLEARNYDQSGNGTYWVNPHYDWGYVDNFSPTDFNSSDMANLFNISNAIDFEGNPVKLNHIDFVKVQCAVNAKSGWLGEISTEVCGFYDYSLKK